MSVVSLSISSWFGPRRGRRVNRVFTQEGGVVIRSQSPVMAGINDDAAVWNKKWKEEVG